MKKNNYIFRLFQRFLNKECSEEELQELFNYFGSANEEQLRTLIRAEMENAPNDIPRNSTVKRPIRQLLPYAAVFLLLILAGIAWFYLPASRDQQVPLESKYGNDVLPGGNQATLTLNDGRTIQLDHIGNGLIAEEKDIKISKSQDGLITYEIQQNEKEKRRDAITYNTIRTPNGGQYQVLLPDGSKVWLNAASSLTFPTYFNGQERRVILEGEAYFEVFSNKEQPFIVACARQEVKVSGTSFNINAYANAEQVKTTLVEGSVEVYNLSTGNYQKLKPGWQSLAGKNGTQLVEADISASIGWKSGEFVFHNMKLPEILRQLQRWYGIEVSLGAHIPDDVFYGEIDRDARLSEVLDMIQSTSTIEFEIDNKKLIVK